MRKKTNNRLSYKYQFELENIPNEIEETERNIKKINTELANNNLYLENPERFNKITNQLRILENFLYNREERWLELLQVQEDKK